MATNSISRFQVNTADEVLNDLRDRLMHTRWTYQIAGSEWDPGTDITYLKNLVAYWQNTYDWRKQEAALNQFAHRKTAADGVGIHFIHERGKRPRPFPLILTHGYPDSVCRFAKIIPMLTDPESFGGRAEDSFDVVVPDLPGYGFSDKPGNSGMVFRANDLWAQLMTDKLGYQKFGAHGGDWGSTVTEQSARSQTDSVVAIHLTAVPLGHFFQKRDKLSPDEEKLCKENEQWMHKEAA